MSKFIQGTLYIMLILIVATTATKQCSVNTMEEDCGKYQTCVAKTTNQDESLGTCECNSGYVMVKDECVPKKKSDISGGGPSSSSLVDSSKDSHIAAAIIVPLLLITIVISSIYVVRKYKVVSWVRGKLNQRSTNYDEVMIGQDIDDDDPPLR